MPGRIDRDAIQYHPSKMERIIVPVLTHDDLEKLHDFSKEVKEAKRRLSVISNWHRLAFRESGIELPYSPDDDYIYITKYLPRNKGEDSSHIDVDGTNALIKKIVKTARLYLHGVRYEHTESSFKVVVTLQDDTTESRWDDNSISVSYVADRSVKCTKKVVGTRTIPSRTEDIVEWDCEKVSYLKEGK